MDPTITIHEGNPAVNIKCHKGLDSVTFTWESDFTEAWIRDNLTEDQICGWFNDTAEDLLECVIDTAKQLFDMDLDIFQSGRMGGWLEVVGLPEVEDWDVELFKTWKTFEEMCEQAVEDVNTYMADNIYHNVYLTQKEDLEKAKEDRAAMWIEVENYLFMFASNYDDWVVILPEHMDAFKAACPLLMKKLKE